MPESDEAVATPLQLLFQAAPLIDGAVTNEWWFLAVYAPLTGIGLVAGASPAAAVVGSTLLYCAAASLSDEASGQGLLALFLSNLVTTAVLLSLELDAAAPRPSRSDELAADRRIWDGQFKDAMRRKDR